MVPFALMILFFASISFAVGTPITGTVLTWCSLIVIVFGVGM